MSTVATAEPTPAPTRRRPAWAIAVIALAVLAVAAALVVAFRGLTGNPVRGTDPSGLTVLGGTWEPYTCSAAACQGYVQEGGRSVFVRFPDRCGTAGYPRRSQDLTVRARVDHTLGNAAYLAPSCLR